jgi:hypothetical protein
LHKTLGDRIGDSKPHSTAILISERTAISHHLREQHFRLNCAIDALAVDGWLPIAKAGKWIDEQQPEKYGYRRWRQVVHEASMFDLRYFEVNGQRSASYRKRESAAMTGNFNGAAGEVGSGKTWP